MMEPMCTSSMYMPMELPKGISVESVIRVDGKTVQ